MAKREPKGYYKQTRNGTEYWYARIPKPKAMGPGEEGKQRAIAARAKYVSKRYEHKDDEAGLNMKRIKLATIDDLHQWYFTRPKIQKLESFHRKMWAAVRILDHFRTWRVSNITVDDLEEYREKRLAEGAADGTINFELSQLRAMYRLAVKRGKLPRNVIPGEFPQEGETVPRNVISDEDYQKIIKEANQGFADTVICAGETAMRSKEVCNLKAGDVVLDLDWIGGKPISYLKVLDVKNKEFRFPPVSKALRDVLERRIQGLSENDYVFTTSRSTKWTPVHIRKSMMRTCKRAGVAYGDKIELDEEGKPYRVGITFHCLRHTRTSKWVEAGFSDEIIRKATGHKDLSAYRIYIHLNEASTQRLVDYEASEYGNGIRYKTARIENSSEANNAVAKG